MEGVQTVQHDPFTSGLSGRRLGRYEVLTRLATGGMAGVYVARAQGVAGFERLFAIKILHPHLAHEEEFIAMFLDEARLAARIRHPNVVPTIDISDTQDAGYYLVMDYIEGDHLGALMRQASQAEERLPVPDSLRIVVDALSGLSAAHELTDESGQPLHIVHRDVSPQNIMVGTDGISRLTDFGVAKAETRLATTREGEFKGKLAYMAPEHVSEGYADQRSDLFAMGIVLWECLTGQRLFRADNQAATLNKVCLEPIPLPSAIDIGLEPFDAIADRALQRDPERRFQSAAEFIEAIEAEASKHGGLGSRRTVSNLVRKYAAEKLARDRELVRKAIAALGAEAASASHPTPLAAPAYGQPNLAAPQAPLDGPEQLPPALEGIYEPLEGEELEPLQPPASRGRKMAWIIGGVSMGVAAAVTIAFAFMDLGKQSEVTTSPLYVPPTRPRPSSIVNVTPHPVPIPTPVTPATQSVSPATPAAANQPRAREQAEAPKARKELANNAEPRHGRKARNQDEKREIQPTSPVTAPQVPNRAASQEIPSRPPQKPPKRAADDEVIVNPYR